MPKISDNELSRVCIRVWSDDYEYLRRVSLSQGTLGLNLLIRQIIHTYVTHLKDAESQELNKLPVNGLKPINPIDMLLIKDIAQHEVDDNDGIDISLAIDVDIGVPAT